MSSFRFRVGLLALASLLLSACGTKSDPDVGTAGQSSDAGARNPERPPPEASNPKPTLPTDAGNVGEPNLTRDASVDASGPATPNFPEPEPEPVTSATPTTTTPISEPTPEPAMEPVEGPPSGWTCTFNTYGDGSLCNCGCGVRDPDCEDGSVGSCDVCLTGGSCSGGGCPSSVAADDNAVCDVPEGWTCAALQYGDGFCHCGCGVLDLDCASASLSDCETCHTGCSTETCPGPIDAEDNTLCTGVPAAWTCDARFFGDGELCHCGCGAFDPDCESVDLAACDRCDFEGSCSPLECPGTIHEEDNRRCSYPEPPEEWLCSPMNYADGYCDCGCGAVDFDCADTETSSCARCLGCGGICEGRIDPEDSTTCLPVPEEWTCEPYTYGDGWCNCGCGVVDVDCPSTNASACDACGYCGSCATYDCTEVLPDDNAHCVGDAPPEWTCEPSTYGDEACDCGCGTRDSDCLDGLEASCDFCNGDGSCSEDACPGTINLEDNAVCAP